jgi:hypothetical protein
MNTHVDDLPPSPEKGERHRHPAGTPVRAMRSSVRDGVEGAVGPPVASSLKVPGRSPTIYVTVVNAGFLAGSCRAPRGAA